MSIQNDLLAMAGKRTKAKSRAMREPVEKAVAKERRPTLAGVSFASARAVELAREAGLSWRDFVGARCTGCAGYTADDVRAVIGGRDA